MRIDSKNTANLTTLDSTKVADNDSITPKQKVNFSNRYIDNGYSTIKTRELNNSIGILQIASQTITDMLNSDSLAEITVKLSDAKLFNKQIFTQSQIIKDDDGNIIFDANRILDSLPDSDRDIAIFKKSLKIEDKAIKDTLRALKEQALNVEDIAFDKDFLVSNASLFAKSHNISSLASKIDTLLL